MDITKAFTELVATQAAEVGTVVCEADTSGSLAGKSFKFTTTDGTTDYTHQVYFVVAGVGEDPTLGSIEISRFTCVAESGGNYTGTYFVLYDGPAATEVKYYCYFTIGTGTYVEGATNYYDPKVGARETSTITLRADAAGDLDGKYWILADGGDNAFYVWYAVVDDTNTDPAPGGTGIKVFIVTGESAANVARLTAEAIQAQQTAEFGAVWNGAATITITNVSIGAATNAADGDISGTFAVSIDYAGVAAIGAISTATLLAVINLATGDTAEEVSTKIADAIAAIEGWGASGVPKDDVSIVESVTLSIA